MTDPKAYAKKFVGAHAAANDRSIQPLARFNRLILVLDVTGVALWSGVPKWPFVYHRC